MQEVLLVLFAKIQGIANGSEEEKAKVIQAAKDNYLNPKFFVDTCVAANVALDWILDYIWWRLQSKKL